MEASSPGSEESHEYRDALANAHRASAGDALDAVSGSAESSEDGSTPQPVGPQHGPNPDLIARPTISQGTDRFIFVNANDSSLPGQRQRPNQKTINAHVQTTAFRQRRSAAVERLKRNVTANMGLSRPTARRPQISTSVAASSVRGSAPAASALNIQEWLGRPGSSLASFNNDPMLMGGASSDMDEEEVESGELRAMQIVLKSIMKRMSTLEKSQTMIAPPSSLLDTAEIDPFATASLPMTKAMNASLHHCESIRLLPPLISGCGQGV